MSHCLNSVNCGDEESLGACTVRFEAAESSAMWLFRRVCGLLGSKSRLIQPGALWLGPGLWIQTWKTYVTIETVGGGNGLLQQKQKTDQAEPHMSDP